MRWIGGSVIAVSVLVAWNSMAVPGDRFPPDKFTNQVQLYVAILTFGVGMQIVQATPQSMKD